MNEIENKAIETAKGVYLKYGTMLKNGDVFTSLEACETAIDELISAYNTMVEVENDTIHLAIDGYCSEISKKYATMSRNQAFNSFLEQKCPMLAAAIQFTYTAIRVAKKKADESSKMPHLEKGFVQRAINPIQFANYAKGGAVCESAEWIDHFRALNLILAVRNAKAIGLTIGEDYKISDKAKAYLKIKSVSEIKSKDYSDSEIQKLFQKVVNLMIGKFDESKVTKSDVQMLIKSEATVRKPGELTILDDNKFSVYILRTINKILTDNGYTVKYKRVKLESKKSEAKSGNTDTENKTDK